MSVQRWTDDRLDDLNQDVRDLRETPQHVATLSAEIATANHELTNHAASATAMR